MTVPVGAAENERRVLVLAPTRRDAEITQALLGEGGLPSHVCASPAEVASGLAAGAGALLLTDAALDAGPVDPLLDALAAQPAWSDVPALVLARAGRPSPAVARLVAQVPSATVV